MSPFAQYMRDTDPRALGEYSLRARQYWAGVFAPLGSLRRTLLGVVNALQPVSGHSDKF